VLTVDFSLPRFETRTASHQSTWRNERRQEHLLAVNGFSSRSRIPSLCGPLQRRPLCQKALLLAAVSGHGFRAAQLTYRESLCDIEACLGAVVPKLYHMGFGDAVARSTLADANENRDWCIFAAFAHVLIRTAIKLYANESIDVPQVRDLYALDSTTIDLCLALFPWAKFRKQKAAVKIHALLDLRGSIRTFIRITDGKVHDPNLDRCFGLFAGGHRSQASYFGGQPLPTSTDFVVLPSLRKTPFYGHFRRISPKTSYTGCQTS
jgi:Domain of unknown function (DUF4372)